MNARATLTLPAPLVDLRQRGLAWWNALSARDRRIARLGGGLVAIGVLWMVAVQPAWRSIRDLPLQIERAEAQLQQMQALAAESKTLRAATPVAPAQAAAALRLATAPLGDKVRLVQQGERMTLSLNGIDGPALRDLLAQARASARARPVEAQLVRGPRGFEGTLVLSLGGAS